MDRVILHCDMNAFYASVELLSHPELRDMPVAVCGNPENRHGIILAKNEGAKRCGIVTAETVWQARKKCPGLILLPPHHKKYSEYCRKINEIYGRFTDMVEPFSIDESWLDVTASRTLFGSGSEIADTIRETIKKELGLTCSVGVSFNKFFAKMGSEYKKPDATTVISRENFRDILWPLPVGEMFFVGAATAAKLRQNGINTIGDLARWDRKRLSALFGKQGESIYDNANGLDQSPVALATERRQIKSVGNGETFRRNLEGEKDVRIAVISLADTVAGRLRKYGLACGGVKVDIKDPNFKTISRQKQLPHPTNTAEQIFRAAMEIIGTSWNYGTPIRLITVTGIQLTGEGEAEQLSFFNDDFRIRERAEKAERTMDTIREKYGPGAITFGGLLNNDIGIEIKDE